MNSHIVTAGGCEECVVLKIELNQYVGRQIREFREHRLPLTQQGLADRLGVSRPSIANIERGRQQLTVSQLVAIAAVFGVPPCDFLPKQDESDSADGIADTLPPDVSPEIIRWLESSRSA
jgi:transcriptional regulator with XRE-family HTH domain